MILCVDDDPSTRLLVEAVLREAGHICRTAQTAAEALGLIFQQAPDLVVLDLDLPDAKGMELYDRIRSLPGHGGTPVLILSSSASADDITSALSAGAEDYLIKPVIPALLLAKISVCMARRAERTPALSAKLTDAPKEVLLAAANPDNLVGKYIIVNELGRGGMGVVYRAWDTTLATWTALKFLLQHLDRVAVERLLREAQTVVRLHHPHICRVYDLRQSDGRHYLAMQYLDGSDCDRMIETRRAAEVAMKIARAVHYAHGEGVIHRDIKPENIIIDRAGKPWITDFGVAQMTQSARSKLTPSGLVVGSLSYMAPEYLAGDGATERTDIYALGATLYHMVTGEPPYDSVDTRVIFQMMDAGDITPPSAIVDDVPEKLEQIILRAMSGDLEIRYRTANDFADDLQAFLEGRPLDGTKSRWIDRLLPGSGSGA